jgi:hypothetical protein
MKKIEPHRPQLACHLICTVRTGTFCAYRADPSAKLAWEL